MNVLELKNVTKKYGEFIAIDDLSLQVQEGKVLSLLGPSGCGKTTTLRMIAGFNSPDIGAVEIFGRNVNRLRPYERNVGLLFQDYALFPHMTVAQNIGYGLRYRGTSTAAISARVNEMLSLVQLVGFENRYPRQLSGGQQQRVALARALATDPQIVLLDEPLSALDAKLRLELRVELKEILRKVRATTIVVTHDQEEALSLGDDVIVMRSGKIAQHGTPTEIYERPANKFVAEFVGRSNWFLDMRQCGQQDAISVFKSNEGIEVRTRETKKHTCETVDLFVRPENIEIVAATPDADGPATKSVSNFLPGIVLDVASLGADTHVVIEIVGKNRLLAIRKNERRATRISPGQSVFASFSPSCVLMF
ncbi:ABC transporter ATP-binding protein [Phyllobacterium endophyticum]|uniref:ABC transporter ATP-binding protein n=1 Tax=Phyllobacterium endophyticum TaxID=1149773 RepID=UPI0016509CDF|nr:ABC transporter ATP-binding protein [Phyllobacterium endophyticum]